MPHRTWLYETQVFCNVLLDFNTLEYHVRSTYSPIPNSHSTHTATIYLPLNLKIFLKKKKKKKSLTTRYITWHQLTLHTFLSLLIFYFFNFYLIFFFLIGFQFCFLFFICILGRCGFHFFLSFVRVTWDGR